MNFACQDKIKHILVSIAVCAAAVLGSVAVPPVAQAQIINIFPTNTPLPQPSATPTATPSGSITASPQPTQSLTVTPTGPVRAIVEGNKTGVFVQNATDTVVVRDGDFLYLGGSFSEVQLASSSAVQRMRLASVNVTQNQVTDWNPSPNAKVETIATDSKLIYTGGRFTQIGSVQRNYIAIFDKATGALTNWDPNANDWVYSIHVDDKFMWVAGRFTAIGGQNRLRIAAFNKTTGEIDQFNPGANDEIYALAGTNQMLYIGGAFTEIGGQQRKYLAAIDKATGAVTTWSPQVNNKVRKIVFKDGQLIVSGPFTQVNGNEVRYSAIIDPSTGQISNEQFVDANGQPVDTNINPRTSITIQIAESDLGFKIPGLADILTFIIRIFFVIAGLVALLYLLLGAFSWITSSGEEEAVAKARQKITAAVIGVILIVAVLAVVVTLEQVVFKARICFGISCPATIPSLVKPCSDATHPAGQGGYVECTRGNGPAAR
jgi:hypothetical protein